MYMTLLLMLMVISSSIYLIISRCTFCRRRITLDDKMSNGRVRFRKIGTNLPVCRSCAISNGEDVE